MERDEPDSICDQCTKPTPSVDLCPNCNLCPDCCKCLLEDDGK